MFINLTPHDINIIDDAGNCTTIPASGIVARCQVSREVVGAIEQIPITATLFGDVEGLPEPRPNTYYIVSRVVAEACRKRRDLFIPDDTVRDEQGRIVGCRALTQM